MSHLNKVILGTLFLVLLGCNTSLTEKKGSVNISIPTVSKVVLSALNSSANNDKLDKDSTRAFVISDSVVISIYQSGSFIESFQFNSDSDTKINLDEGEYSLTIDVYNYDNSQEVPVVSGSSESFTITAGLETSVHVKLLPVEPVTAVESSVVSVTDYNNGMYYSEYNFVSYIGSEHWYEIIPSTTVTTIESINSDSGFNSAEFVLYNNLGEFLYGIDLMSGLLFDSVPGEIYYLAVLPTKVYNGDDYQESSNVEFIYSPANTEDFDNSFSTATAVTADGSVEQGGFVGSADTDFYTVDVTAGTNYVFRNNGEDLNITITDSLNNIVFDGLLSSDYYFSAESSEAIFLEFSDPDGSSREYLFSVISLVNEILSTSSEWQVLDIEYNLSSFYTFDVSAGTSYNLSWDDSYSGSDQFEADVWVSATSNLGDSYFTTVDSGYNSPYIITPGEGVTTITLEINGSWSGGTLGLLVEEVIQ